MPTYNKPRKLPDDDVPCTFNILILAGDCPADTGEEFWGNLRRNLRELF